MNPKFGGCSGALHVDRGSVSYDASEHTWRHAMENGRGGSFCVSSIVLVLLASQLAAVDPAPDCNKNGLPDSEDITAGSSPDGNGNGVPDECESRIRIVEVGPSEIAIAVQHSVPMLGFRTIVAYDSSISSRQPQDRAGMHYTIGTGGIYYVARAICPAGKTDRLLVINWETDEPEGHPPGEHMTMGLLFKGMPDEACSELNLIDCAVDEDNTPIETGFLTMDRRLIPFETEVNGKVCKYDAEVFSRGDADGDGWTNIADAIRILEYLFSGRSALPCLDAADASDAGSLSISSAVYILFWLFRGGSPPPLPGPHQCGVDPTSDPLGCASYALCPFE
jgi:hypothetical protein